MEDENLKKVMKFDSGADGFLKMIYVLAATAIAVLIIGTYYILTTFKFN